MLYLGDCLSVLKTFADNSVDAVVTDPPYGLKFMGKKWDYDVPQVETWKEVLRVLKPGGHALIACGTRTQHRMAVNIEDAGFEIRDVITWLYGSGFPKSLDISKAIDKSAGAEREVLGPDPNSVGRKIEREWINDSGVKRTRNEFLTAPSTDEAKEWQGWGTALKPACEFWTLARKPLSESTVAKNVLKWGVGGINVDGCRVTTQEKLSSGRHVTGDQQGPSGYKTTNTTEYEQNTQGRFPANLILDEQAAFELDTQVGILKSGKPGIKNQGNNGYAYGAESRPSGSQMSGFGDSGGASRFFYCAKASRSERNVGLEGMPEITSGIGDERPSGQSMQRLDGREPRLMANHHPTVKPLKLMEYLCKLITPPNGTVLDPFMGSGSTGLAAKNKAFNFVGVELSDEYFEIAKRRINGATNGTV